MKGRLSDNMFSEMTIVNPPPIQEMTTDEKENPETSSANNNEHNEHTTLEMQAL